MEFYMTNKQGAFITFEGCEGSGKSTHIKLLAEHLGCQCCKVVRALREPGGTTFGEQMRQSLKNFDYNICGIAEVLAMNASRAQLVEEVIRPALERGEIVLCDRFYDSTIAYQGYGRGISLKAIDSVINFACDGLKPDLTFFINAKPEQGLRNRWSASVGITQAELKGAAQKDRFDEEEIEFHQRVYEGYLKIVQKEYERFRVIPYLEGNIMSMQVKINLMTMDLLNERNL